MNNKYSDGSLCCISGTAGEMQNLTAQFPVRVQRGHSQASADLILHFKKYKLELKGLFTLLYLLHKTI